MTTGQFVPLPPRAEPITIQDTHGSFCQGENPPDPKDGHYCVTDALPGCSGCLSRNPIHDGHGDHWRVQQERLTQGICEGCGHVLIEWKHIEELGWYGRAQPVPTPS